MTTATTTGNAGKSRTAAAAARAKMANAAFARALDQAKHAVRAAGLAKEAIEVADRVAAEAEATVVRVLEDLPAKAEAAREADADYKLARADDDPEYEEVD